MHHILRDPIFRAQILDARERVISILSLDHLRSTVQAAEDESEWFDPHLAEQPLDKYTILAFYDSRDGECVNRLDNEVLFPWPFAGYSNEGGLGETSQWWDELIFVGKVDLGKAGALELGEYFGFPRGAVAPGACPSVALLPRGSFLSARRASEVRHVAVSEEYRSFIWAQVMKRCGPVVATIKSTPHPPTPMLLCAWCASCK
jgi:hypothetical protein